MILDKYQTSILTISYRITCMGTYGPT